MTASNDDLKGYGKKTAARDWTGSPLLNQLFSMAIKNESQTEQGPDRFVSPNENESGLVHGILEKVKELFPPGAGYLHDRIDDNASSHIASAFIGASRTFPINSGRLVRLGSDTHSDRSSLIAHVLASVCDILNRVQ